MPIGNQSVKISVDRILLHGPGHPMFENDAHKVAKFLFYLLDDTPSTADWVSEVGACADLQHYFDALFQPAEGQQVGEPIPAMDTRGKVRALCDVLEVPIQDKECD